MSTSDQQGTPLTRKQLRELRLTGATPVIPPKPAETEPEAAAPTPVPGPAVPTSSAPPAASVEGAPLTRRQLREQERLRTSSVSVAPDEDAEARSAESSAADRPAVDESSVAGQDAAANVDDEALEDDRADEEINVIAPVSAAAVADAEGDAFVDASDAVGDAEETHEPGDADEAQASTDEDEPRDAATDRPVVDPAFGAAVLDEKSARVPTFTPSFDELLTADTSSGSQHSAPNTLIFTPSPNDGSLSGPVASTGEILVTGSYELPNGIASRGHADGTADGAEVDAVLIDGELPAASSPTPIAASSAISTIKPAGEVIRPPEPEKGNRLMLTLAIVAGGLALALAVALVVAFTTNVL